MIYVRCLVSNKEKILAISALQEIDISQQSPDTLMEKSKLGTAEATAIIKALYNEGQLLII